ncbi:MAG: secretin and TonB N-terminal domain-containing protein [Thermoanaerobaculia bacterium]
MRYDLLRRSGVLLTLLALLLTSPADAAKAKTKKAPAKPRSTGIPRYVLSYTMKGYGSRMEFIGKILDLQTGQLIASPAFSFADKLRTAGSSGDLQWSLDMTAQPRGTGTAVLSILYKGKEIQRSNYSLVTKATAPPHDPRFDGEPISLTFTNAKLRDALATFTKLAKVQFLIDPDVAGTVNMNIQNVPWDEALDRIITTAGYQWNLEGKKLHVHK